MSDLLLQSASALRARLRAREISARELLAATLAQVDRLNPALNAIIAFDRAAAEKAADESDARIASGDARPLEGLPITIKDSYETTGMVTACGRCRGGGAAAPRRRRHLRQDQRADLHGRFSIL